MQRQSLGSPSSKLVKDEQQQQLPSQSSSSPATIHTGGLLYGEECREEEELKKLKPKTTTPQSYIHLIPILTILCILILYLSSHDPSLKDLTDFNGAKSLSNYADSDENSISELQRILAIEKGDILAIRSLKNLKQDAAAKQRRLHRKIAHF